MIVAYGRFLRANLLQNLTQPTISATALTDFMVTFQMSIAFFDVDRSKEIINDHRFRCQQHTFGLHITRLSCVVLKAIIFMREKNFLEATPIAKIVACGSGETVGWVYEWNTGETAMFWIKAERELSEVAIVKYIRCLGI